MIGPDGEARFCPGCPASGNYVGRVGGDENYIEGRVEPDYTGYLQLVDQDGMRSQKLKLDTQASSAVLDAPEPIAEEALGRRLGGIFQRRVGDCAVGTILRPKVCPAVNSEIASAGVIRNLKELTNGR